jgi:hypothetical protein
MFVAPSTAPARVVDQASWGEDAADRGSATRLDASHAATASTATRPNASRPHGKGSGAVLDLLRDEQRQAAIRRRERLKLGGLVNIAVGVGLMVALAQLAREAYLVGLIPLLIGAALLGYAAFLYPRE